MPKKKKKKKRCQHVLNNIDTWKRSVIDHNFHIILFLSDHFEFVILQHIPNLTTEELRLCCNYKQHTQLYKKPCSKTFLIYLYKVQFSVNYYIWKSINNHIPNFRGSIWIIKKTVKGISKKFWNKNGKNDGFICILKSTM